MKILKAILSLFGFKGKESKNIWEIERTNTWLSENSFKRYRNDDSVWILRKKKGLTIISFCVKIFKDGSCISMIMAAKSIGSNYWCSKDQKRQFGNPIDAFNDCLSGICKPRTCEEIVFDDFMDELIAFSSSTRKWTLTNTSSKFICQ